MKLRHVCVLFLFNCGLLAAPLPLHFEMAPGSPRTFLSRDARSEVTLAAGHIRIQLPHSPAIELHPAAGSALPEPEGEQRTGGYSNYLIGNNPDEWRTRVAHFQRIRYRKVYKGIDLVFYGNPSQLEYDFIVRPGADPSKIALRFTGAQSYELNAQGDLILDLGNGRISQPKPNGYQMIGGKRRAVKVSYVLSKTPGLIRFALGKYDPHLPLIIDPILLYGTFVGGSGTDFASAVAADSSGNAYIAGSTSSISIPGRPPQQFLRGPSDCFVTKINPAGTLILYTTYIGGLGRDTCSSLSVDRQGSVFAVGTTASADFPVTAGAVQTRYAGGAFDGFLVRIDATGSRLTYSTFIGGGEADLLTAVANDASGNAYIAGSTTSRDVIEIANDASIQFRNAGSYDGFLVKVNNTGTAVIYATYLGGSNDDFINGLAVNSGGEAYVTGETASPAFPGTARSPIQPLRKGAKRDAFATKISAKGFEILYSTFLGGSADQSASAIAVDGAGNAYITGFTTSVDFPIRGTPLQQRNQGGMDAFISQITNDGICLCFSTYLGGSGTDEGQSILADRRGNLYIAGFTNSANFLQNYRVLPPPRVDSLFVTKITHSTGKAVFSTYFSPADQQSPIALGLGAGASFDQIFAAGTAVNNFRFPASKSPPILPYAGGLSDAFVSRLTSADVRIISGNPSSGLQRTALTEPPSENVVPGGSITLPFTVTNFGPDDADDVVATVTIPPELTPIRCIAIGGTCTIAGALVTVRYTEIAFPLTRTFTVVARATGTGTVSVSAEVNSATDDGNTTNNASVAEISIIGQRPFVTNPVVAVEFGNVAVGQSKVAGIRVTPNGPVDLELVLSDAQGGASTVFRPQAGTNAAQRIAVVTDLQFVFTPTAAGAATAQLDIRAPEFGYTATLDLNGSGIAAPPVVMPPPTITGVSDAAAFRPNMIASNAWITILGTNFTTKLERKWQGNDFIGTQLPRFLDDVTVKINGRPAYISFMNPGQINALAPSDPVEGANVTVEVSNNQGTASVSVRKERYAPAFYILPGNHVAARLPDSTVVGPAGFLGPNAVTRPARPGDTVQLFLNGLGPTTPAFPDGAIPTSALNVTPAAMSLSIGGATVVPSFVGLSTTPGLYQINAVVPNVPDGEATITFQIGGRTTQLPATLTVRR